MHSICKPSNNDRVLNIQESLGGLLVAFDPLRQAILLVVGIPDKEQIMLSDYAA
jgi:hypothetical protein